MARRARQATDRRSFLNASGVALAIVLWAAALLCGCRHWPVLKPDALPATRQLGGLSVTLAAVKPAVRDPSGHPPYQWEKLPEGFLTGSWTSEPRVQPGNEGRVIEFRLEMHQDGKLNRDWQFHGLTVTDPRGRGVGDPLRQIQHGLRAPVLWAAGPADAGVWKVAVSFHAGTAYQGFGPDELWTVRGVRMPGPKAGVPLGAGATLQGVTLRPVCLAPPGKTAYSGGVLTKVEPTRAGPGISWSGGPQNTTVETSVHSVAVAASNWQSDLQLSMRATDERGGPCEQTGESSSRQDDELWQVMALSPPAGAKKLDLTFIVQKVRVAEFVIEPPPADPRPSGAE